tara:strand:+ start:524 stop:1390 length:867 start_codon:yes stop_codon:yes gene_type:complete
MTLIVGRITQGGIRVDSDSRITDRESVANRNDIFTGLLKTVIVNPKISVSYANGVDTAQIAINEIFKLEEINTKTVNDLLLKIHLDSKQDTDFLIASIENETLLYKICKGKIEISNNVHWIGDVDGFNIYQKNFWPNLKNNDPKHISEVHSKAFIKAIEANEAETIGGFHITIHLTNRGYLEYMEKGISYSGFHKTIKLKEGFTPLPLGNSQTGAFSECFLKSKNPFKPAIAIHYGIANFGVLFYPRESNKIIKIDNVNPFEFAKVIKEKYELELTGSVKNGDMITKI